jgi:hypothetical protein
MGHRRHEFVQEFQLLRETTSSQRTPHRFGASHLAGAQPSLPALPLPHADHRDVRH